MAGKSISNAVRKIAEKAIAQKYPNAGMYAVDKARGEGRSVISAARHAKFTENFREANQQAVSRRKSNSAAVAKVVAPKTKTSGLQGRGGPLGGGRIGGDFQDQVK